MNPQELRTAVSTPDVISRRAPELLRQLSSLHQLKRRDAVLQELILRALEHRDAFGAFSPALDTLARELGLFPYLSPEKLSTADRLAFEAHRAPNLGDVVFHHPQARVYWTLRTGRSVVLSAPTSFGKSLVIDALIATGSFKNIVVVVPTLALMDETRRRLSRFRAQYAIITQTFQVPQEKNIYVMTQERMLSTDIHSVDFFVIDEFYKLAPTTEPDGERCALLNQAFYRLLKLCPHFYLLGPGIAGLSTSFRSALQFDFLSLPYHTVVSEVHRVRPESNPLENLAALASGLVDPTLVFCRSPDRTKSVATALPSRTRVSSLVREAAEWIGQHYHPEWHFAQALARGIGIHHGRIPRSLAQFVVRAFNTGQLRFIVCTSTLIEGVNTKAKNIVVFDNTINRNKLDLFTFNNIKGRSGRMFQHFVGHVYLFHDPPTSGLPFVDVPAFSQSATAPDSLLVQLDPADLTQEATERLVPYLENPYLPIQVIQQSPGVDPQAQLALAEEISRHPRRYHSLLHWTRHPTWEQLLNVAELIWTFFKGGTLGGRTVRSPKHLAFLVRGLSRRRPTRELIQAHNDFARCHPDESVRAVLDFQRLWASFHFPRLLGTINLIQKHVFGELELPAGAYEHYASQVERLFHGPFIATLEEYGIPMPLALKLEHALGSAETFEEVLARLKAGVEPSQPLSRFESHMLSDAISYL